ncbi:MAG: PpiC-type peptidyl-prolyl cis-trans isomerase [Armatimonadetes bacterium]|nr:PpiC-type peptidyl-prolyl cis-trans isomerase [Armatimonadota bacterium]
MIFLLSSHPGRALSRLIITSALVMALGAGVQAQETPPKPAEVASVNGKVLTEREFQKRCEVFVGGGSDTAVGYLVLKEWIQQVIAEEEARKKNVLPTPMQLEARVKVLRRQFELRGEKFEDWLAVHGRTLQSLQEDVRQQLVAENLLTEGIAISDTEVQLYYENNKQVLTTPASVRISRITVSDKKVAQEVDAALKQGGSFEELARKRSIDPYKDAGGKIPNAIEADPKAKGPLEPGLLEKVLKLEKGKSAGPIKLDSYWVFVRLDEFVPASIPALSDVQELLRANMKVQKSGPDRLKATQDHLEGLLQEAKVEIFRPEYGHLLKLLKSDAKVQKDPK